MATRESAWGGGFTAPRCTTGTDEVEHRSTAQEHRDGWASLFTPEHRSTVRMGGFSLFPFPYFHSSFGLV